MNQLLFIETFVLGASAIAGTYHLMLFIQQREKYLIAYSIYLFSLASYIGFKLISGNYDPYAITYKVHFYFIEEFLQITMVCIYATFAAITLNVTRKDKVVMGLWYFILSVGAVSIATHVYMGIGEDAVHTSRLRYAVSRFTIIGSSVTALIVVWQSRKTIFQRTIIIGSFVYAFAGFTSALSFTVDGRFFGLKGVEPYLIGCLVDIIIFSSAFGYRIKQIALEKNQLLKAELENQLMVSNMRTDIASNLHDDIGSTLSSLSIYSEAAKSNILNGKNEMAIDLLSRLGSEARETISSMSDIVWAINPRNDNSQKLIERMKSYASEVCRAKGMELKMDFTEMEVMQDWSMAMRNNLFLIFKEAVNNCVKYSDASLLHVEFKRNRNGHMLIISDNGKGFNIDFDIKNSGDSGSGVNGGGNGLMNMHNRAKEINAKLKISSSPGEGTEICLDFLK